MVDETPNKNVQTIVHLAIGLLQQQESIDKGESRPVILLNDYLQWGWDELAFQCIMCGTTPPAHLPDLVNWLHQPVEQWDKVGALYQAVGITGALLEEGFPSYTCKELGKLYYQARDPQAEFEDTPFKDILAYCRSNNLPEQYSRAREFLVRHPYLPDGIITITTDTNWDDHIRRLLKSCYEPLPIRCRQHDRSRDMVVLCPRCGWPLEWRNNQAHCHDQNTCRDAVGELSESTLLSAHTDEAVRTTPGIQQSVVSPEVELIQLYDQLVEDYHLHCTLWPEIDSYDMRVKVRSDCYFALDMKNYDPKNIQAVAARAGYFKSYPEWQQAFYIFPDYRWKRNYRNVFFQMWTQPPDTKAVSVSEFLDYLKAQLDDEAAT